MPLGPADIRRLLREAPPAGGDEVGIPHHAAVLVAFVFRPEAHVVLIRRAERGDPWSGQFAFPGGRIEPDDASAWRAACRETAEEIGIPPDGVDCLGPLGLFPTYSRSVLVHAYAAIWRGTDELRPAPEEVAEVLEIPLAGLLGAHESAGLAGQSPDALGARLVYPAPGGVIWGVTARILHHVLEVLGA
jgi:8-oxo-dGTP pyrophosphatase MutT (NUDIX family)